MEYDSNGCCLQNVFRAFVCVSLSVLLGLHVYSYFWEPGSEGLEGDFSDIKYIVAQLTRGLTEVNRKHERLQGEMERLSSALPAVTAAAGRARDALEPHSQHDQGQAVDIRDYDRQVVDFALESAGARVLDVGNTVEHVVHESPAGWALLALTTLVSRPGASAAVALRPGALPGECWAFKGAKGELTIRLLGTVQVSGLSLEHIPAQISPTREISSAPRHFKLEGLSSRTDPQPHDFGTFEYNKQGTPIQYFAVKHPASKGYNIVRLKVLSNWGHHEYTCLYRVRVHGDLVPFCSGARCPRSGRASGDDNELRIENE